MKKNVSLFLICLLLFGLLACGQSETQQPEKASEPASTTSDESEGTDNEVTEVPEEDGDALTRICVMINGELGDLAWYDATRDGALLLQETFPDEIEVDYIEMTSDESKYTAIIEDACDEEYDIIVGGGWSLLSYFEEAAAAHPDIKFWFFDEPVEGYENLYSMTYKQHEGAFLAGMMAGSLTETDMIGFIGGEDSTVINDFLLGFADGARYVNPDCEILVSYVNSWSDAAKAKEIALAQYSAGADVIEHASSSAGLGVFEAAQETGNLAIGGDTDQAAYFTDSNPERAACIVTSVIKDLGGSFVQAWEKERNGELPYGTSEPVGLSVNCVDACINEYTRALCSKELLSSVEQARQDIIDGKITVSTAYGLSVDEVAAIKETYAK